MPASEIDSKKAVGWKGKLSLFFLSLALSLVACEAALRWRDKLDPPPYPPMCRWAAEVNCELYEEYKPHGYRLRPSRATTYFYPYFSPNRRLLTMVSNKHGFRSARDFEEPAGRTRVIVLGDSQTFGEGVEESERFTDLVEAMEPSWRVDNLGMPGYGLDLMLRALETVGLRLKPDVVVMSIYAGDFARVYPYYSGPGFPIPRFRLESDRLVSIPYPAPRLWDEIRLFQGLRRIYWTYSNAKQELNTAILDRFLDLGRAHSFIPVVVFLPKSKPDAVEAYEYQENYALIERYATQHAVPFLDLSEPLHKAGWKHVLIESNPHLNPHGHQIVAAEMRRFLAEQGLTARRASH